MSFIPTCQNQDVKETSKNETDEVQVSMKAKIDLAYELARKRVGGIRSI